MGEGEGEGEGESTTSVVSRAEDKPGGGGPSVWGGAPCLCRAGYGFLLAAYDGSSASSFIRFCSAACGGDDRLLEFPIHPADPLPPLICEETCRSTSEFTSLAGLYAQGRHNDA